MDTKFERGPLIDYQIIWKSGHIETIKAHQVSYPDNARRMFGEPAPDERERVRFHGEFDSHWQLVLEADLGAIDTIRNLSICGDEAQA